MNILATFIATHIKKHIMTKLSLPLKVSKTICFHYPKRKNSNANIIALSKNQCYKHNQINKASTFINFCYVLSFSYSPVLSFLHVILLNSTIYFRIVAKVFDWQLSGSYDVSWLKIFLKVLDKFFCHNKY